MAKHEVAKHEVAKHEVAKLSTLLLRAAPRRLLGARGRQVIGHLVRVRV